MVISQREVVHGDDAAGERVRLVRLCMRLTGDPEAAEDLAQETLLAGWRLAYKLRDEHSRFPWLAAIARNLCRRWARHRQRERTQLQRIAERVDGEAVDPSADLGLIDVELELERHELARLLERALTLLPPDTGQILIERYVHESSPAAIAARLGVSADAVGMRLRRGKLHLQRTLTRELRAESVAIGLCDPGDAGWEETRIWCPICGQRRLLGSFERPAGRLTFRCPGCSPDPAIVQTECRLANPTFGRLVGGLSRFKPALNRTLTWSDGYFRPGLSTGVVACTACGQPTPLRRVPTAPGMSVDPFPRLVARCAACGETSSTSLTGLVLAHPAVRRFWRHHPRLHTLPVREIDVGERSALLLRVEAVTEPVGLDIVSDRATYAVLAVQTDGAETDRV